MEVNGGDTARIGNGRRRNGNVDEVEILFSLVLCFFLYLLSLLFSFVLSLSALGEVAT